MTKSIATITLATALIATGAVSAAEARHYARGHRVHDYGARFEPRSGPWIVTLVGQARDGDHGNCYTRYGRRFCE